MCSEFRPQTSGHANDQDVSNEDVATKSVEISMRLKANSPSTEFEA